MKFLLKVLVLMGQLLVALYLYYLVFSYSSFYCLLMPIVTYVNADLQKPQIISASPLRAPYFFGLYLNVVERYALFI